MAQTGAILVVGVMLSATITAIYLNHRAELKEQARQQKEQADYIAELAQRERDYQSGRQEAEGRQREIDAANRAAIERAKLDKMEEANAIASEAARKAQDAAREAQAQRERDAFEQSSQNRQANWIAQQAKSQREIASAQRVELERQKLQEMQRANSLAAQAEYNRQLDEYNRHVNDYNWLVWQQSQRAYQQTVPPIRWVVPLR